MTYAAILEALGHATDALQSIAFRTTDYTLGMHIADEVSGFSDWLNELSKFVNANAYRDAALYRVLEAGFSALATARAHAVTLAA